MSVSDVIVSGIKVGNQNVLFELSRQLNDEVFVDAVKSARHKANGPTREAFFCSLNQFLRSCPEKSSDAYWQLTYEAIRFLNGWPAAQAWLLPIVLKKGGNWASYVYAKSQLKLGQIEDAIAIVTRAKLSFPGDKKFDQLLLLAPFFKGDLSFYNRYSIAAQSTDPYFVKTLVKLHFIRRDFAAVIELLRGRSDLIDGVMDEIKHRSEFHIQNTEVQKGNLGIPLYVIAGDKDTARMRRFHYSCSTFALTAEFVQATNGGDVPQIFRKSWLTTYDTITDKEKTFGAFASHLKVWERIAESDIDGAVVCEDDAIFIDNPCAVIRSLKCNDLVFLNDRMMGNHSAPLTTYKLNDAIRIFQEKRRIIGADCYYIPSTIARLAIDLAASNKFADVVDKFLLEGPFAAGANRPKAVMPAPSEHADEEYFP